MANEMQQGPAFQTQRRRVLEAYKNAGQDFTARTKPYKSSGFIRLTPQQATVNGNVCYVALPQTIEFFSYKLGDGLPNAPPGFRTANEGDTNQSKPRQTNGTDDFIIEGISFSNRGLVVAYSAADVANLLDESVVMDEARDALLGLGVMHDPGSHFISPELQSPFNLEDPVLEALAPFMACTFEWDRGTIEHIGTVDQIPEGGAKSYLRSHGEPTTMDRFKVPEGFLWRRASQPDCDFITRVELKEAVVIPGSLVEEEAHDSFVTPVAVYALLCCRLHGLSVKLPTHN
jgi:hypothetical protein